MNAVTEQRGMHVFLNSAYNSNISNGGKSAQANKLNTVNTFLLQRTLTGGPRLPMSPLTPRAPVIPYVQRRKWMAFMIFYRVTVHPWQKIK